MKYVIVFAKENDWWYRLIGLSNIKNVIDKKNDNIRWITLSSWIHRYGYNKSMHIYLKLIDAGIDILNEKQTIRVLRNKGIPYRIYK